MQQIAVLGAGVNGLACAVRIKENFENFEVVLISKDFSPNTTGDGSAGFWYPYLCGDTSQHKILKWGKETYVFMHKLWREGRKGICALPAYVFDEIVTEECHSWKEFVFGFQVIDQRHLQYMSDLHSSSYKCGIYFTTFTTEPTHLLPYLNNRFIKAGGKIVEAYVPSLRCDLLKEFDVIINCVGLGARTLVSDYKVFPIRGQVARVKAPWIYEVIIDHSSENYIIPNTETCVLGGTHQENDYNTSVDSEDSKFIIGGCQKILPSLESAEIHKEWTGLRPARESVRLECETIDNKLVVHNYGHGGSGVTLFWGCAGNVLEILEDSQNKKSRIANSTKMSKL